MKPKTSLKCLSAVLLSATLSLPSFADDQPTKKDDKKTGEPDMMAMMMELAKPGDNHKLLEGVVGKWSYAVKFWMSPDAPPSESTGFECTTHRLCGSPAARMQVSRLDYSNNLSPGQLPETFHKRTVPN